MRRRKPSIPDEKPMWEVLTDQGTQVFPMASPQSLAADLNRPNMTPHDVHVHAQLWFIEATIMAGPAIAIDGLRSAAEIRRQSPTHDYNVDRFLGGIIAAAELVQNANFDDSHVLGFKAGLGVMGQVKGE